MSGVAQALTPARRARTPRGCRHRQVADAWTLSPQGHARSGRRVRGRRGWHRTDAPATELAQGVAGGNRGGDVRCRWTFACLVLLIAGSGFTVRVDAQRTGAGVQRARLGGHRRPRQCEWRQDVSMPTLGTAFRIGMEESRFVNVRVPTSRSGRRWRECSATRATRIDREVGSEIALREQARAVIVPSIAQFGHKLRLSAELIDPHGARTVSIQTADADDPNDVLPAIDRLFAECGRVSANRSSRSSRRHSHWRRSRRPTSRLCERFRARWTSRAKVISSRREDFLTYATELDPGFATAYARSGLNSVFAGTLSRRRA